LGFLCCWRAGDLESKLEVAEAEVSQMRDAISMMSKRLEAREKSVAAQLQVCVLGSWLLLYM
jgi:hypothetical protein